MSLPAHLAHLDALLDLLVEAVVREIHVDTGSERPESLQGNPRGWESEANTTRAMIAHDLTQSPLSVEEPLAAEGQRG